MLYKNTHKCTYTYMHAIAMKKAMNLIVKSDVWREGLKIEREERNIVIILQSQRVKQDKNIS